MRDHMDPVLSRALEQVYDDLVTTKHVPVRAASAPLPTGSKARIRWVTVAVAVVVVLAAGLVIRAGQQRTEPAIATTPTAAVLDNVGLLKKLPRQQYGRVIHTWTDGDTTSATGPFALVGSTAVIAGVCSGNGAISIKPPHGSAHTLTCATVGVQQPFWKFNLGGDGKSTTETGPVHVSVTTLSGAPHYVVRLWAVDPRILDSGTVSVAATSATVPKSLRTCTAQDLAPKALLDWRPSSHSAVVTIEGRNATDCAIRSWPSMRYLDADAKQVGPAQGVDNNGKSVDSSEGALNKYGEFPPARLTSGGRVYLIIDLSTEAQLRKEDAEQVSRPTPTADPSIPFTPCRPERVKTVQLDIGSATVTASAPATPAPAACRTSSRVFGVDPVVVKRPAGR